MENLQIVSHVVSGKLPPMPIPNVAKELNVLLTQCLNNNPELRPEMKTVAEKLDEIEAVIDQGLNINFHWKRKTDLFLSAEQPWELNRGLVSSAEWNTPDKMYKTVNLMKDGVTLHEHSMNSLEQLFYNFMKGMKLRQQSVCF